MQKHLKPPGWATALLFAAFALLFAALLASCSVVNTSTSEKTAYTETGTSVVAVVDDTGPDIGIPINLENTDDLALQPIALRDDGGGGTTEFNCNVDFSSDSRLVVDYGHDPGSTNYGKYIDDVSSTSSLAEESKYQTSCNSANFTHSSLAAINSTSPELPVLSWTSTPRYMMRC